MAEEEIRGKPEPSQAREITRRVFRHENAVLIIVLAGLIGIMGGVTKGATLSRANMMNVLLQSAIRGIASVGQAFVILSAGIDLSVGGMGLFSATLGASLMATGYYNIVTPGFIGVGLGILIMLAAALGWGALNGSAVSRIGMPPLIVTLAMWQITKGFSFLITQGRSLAQQPEGLTVFGRGDVGGVPVPVIIFIVVVGAGYFVLSHTTFGRSVYAVGGNPLSAWLSGIKVKNILFSVYVISGFLAGLAGVIMTARTMAASMLTLLGLELDSIAAVCIGGVSLAGGKGTLIGVLIGVLIVGVINNGMSILGAGPDIQDIVTGAIIFTAVAIDFMRRR